MINIILWMIAIILGLFILSTLIKGLLIATGFIVMVKEEYNNQKQLNNRRDK